MGLRLELARLRLRWLTIRARSIREKIAALLAKFPELGDR